jgi:hypothetical protein
MPDGPAADDPGGQAPDGTERLLGHLDSYFLVAELVAGWRAGLLRALLAGPGLELALDAERLGFDLTVLLEMVEQWPRLMPDLTRSLADGRGIPYAAYDSPAGLRVYAGHVPA